MATVAQVTKKTPACQFVYRCDISSHFRSLYNTDIPQVETSEWFMMNQGVVGNFGHAEGNQMTEMSQQISMIMREKQKVEIEVENLRITTKMLAAHNQELLKHVSNLTCADDVERKDGNRRPVMFAAADREMPDLVEEDCDEDDAEEEKILIRTITQNVTKPVDFRYGSGTTIDMENDLRMKIDAKKLGKLQTRVSPNENSAMGNGPDLDELPEVNQGFMGAPPVKTLQGLEGAVVRRHGAVPGINTSSSSSASDDITMEEKTKQVPNIAKGRATIRRSGVTQSLRKVGVGRAKLQDVAKIEDSVFVNVKGESAATQPLPPTKFFPAAPMGAMASAGAFKAKAEEVFNIKAVELKGDPYAFKTPVKGEPTKPAKEEAVVIDEEMDVSMLRADTDDDNDAVSESNLSDVQVIEEFPEVELEKTEQILEKMGGKPVPSPGESFSELCGDIEMMLNPTTSTPSRNVSRSSTASTHSSMPPLEELSSSATSDSGNATDMSEPPATPASLLSTADTVTVKFEDRFLVNNLLIMNNIFCSRTTSSTSEPRDKKQSSLSMMCTILHNELLIYLFNLFRHLVFNHVSEIFRNYYVQRVSVHRNFALGK